MVAAKEHVEMGRAALRVGDATGARAEFERGELTPEVLEGLAAASYVLSEYPRAIAEFERAYAGYRLQGDGAGSARAARTLGYLYGTTAGDWAVASGWIARAETLLSELPQPSERGWVALTEGMFAEARAKKETAFHTAIEIGRETDDPHLTFATMSYLGASLVHGDRTEEGMALLDEALAAVAGGEVEDFIIIEEIFCQLFSACEHAQDVHRAEQWIRVGEQIAERRRLPAVSAYCRTHYGGILTAAGRWPEADVALTEAVRLWALGKRSLKAGALIRLAGLRIKQGRYDEAASLLEDQTDGEAVCPVQRCTSHAGSRGSPWTCLPFEMSLCRLDLARACSRETPEVAVAEARAALAVFEKLEAARYVDAASAVLRELGQKVAPPRPSGQVLTKREADVLGLQGEGLSNPEIAERLFISRKTVEHHVGNLLLKLGLRNRAEATAYAVRREPAGN